MGIEFSLSAIHLSSLPGCTEYTVENSLKEGYATQADAENDITVWDFSIVGEGRTCFCASGHNQHAHGR
jgi:hypothetical protein